MGTHPAQVHRQKIADRQASRDRHTCARVVGGSLCEPLCLLAVLAGQEIVHLRTDVCA